MCRVNVLKDRNKWRVRVIDRDTGKMTSKVYSTHDEARNAVRRIKMEYRRPAGMALSKAIEAYELHLRTKGNRIRSIAVTVERLQTLLSGLGTVITGELKLEAVAKAWQRYVTTPGRRTKKVPAIDTQIGVLKQARTFFQWCSQKEWMKSDPLAGLEVIGRRKKGKPQLTIDEAKKFLAKAIELGKAGDGGAVAAATALLMGMRASEIADRIVRNLDDAGRILIITSAKTEAGIRRLQIPEMLRPLMQELANGKRTETKIFGEGADRYWVRHAVRRICRTAGVPLIPAHGLRGTHATLAIAAGMTGDAVAASLGHENFGVTAAHYARPEAVADARNERVGDSLN